MSGLFWCLKELCHVHGCCYFLNIKSSYPCFMVPSSKSILQGAHDLLDHHIAFPASCWWKLWQNPELVFVFKKRYDSQIAFHYLRICEFDINVPLLISPISGPASGTAACIFTFMFCFQHRGDAFFRKGGGGGVAVHMHLFWLVHADRLHHPSVTCSAVCGYLACYFANGVEGSGNFACPTSIFECLNSRTWAIIREHTVTNV